MGSSDWHNGPSFENEGDIHVGLFADRYMACCNGYGPTCFMVPDEQSVEEGERVRPRCDEEDREALRMLLRKLGHTVKETYTMRYEHEVKELICSRRWISLDI